MYSGRRQHPLPVDNGDGTLWSAIFLTSFVLFPWGRDFKMNSCRILIFHFQSGEQFRQKFSRIEKANSIVSTTPLEKDYFYPSVGNIPCMMKRGFDKVRTAGYRTAQVPVLCNTSPNGTVVERCNVVNAAVLHASPPAGWSAQQAKVFAYR
jgi:hypothetical protein